MSRQMTAITLPYDQYRAYTLDGRIVAERRTRAHTLNEKAGGGFEAILREGDDFPDGLSVSFSITDEQLNELGYLTKAQVEEAIIAEFDDQPKDASVAVGIRTTANRISKRLALVSPYEGALERKTAAEQAAMPIPEMAEMPDIEPPFDFFPMIDFEDDEEPEPTTPAEYFGTTDEVYREAMVVEFGYAEAHNRVEHFVESGCPNESSIRQTIAKIEAEKQKPADPPKFAFCPWRGEMLNPIEHGSGDDLLVFCTICSDQWVRASSHKRYGGFFSSVDTTGNRVHPEAV